MHTCCPTFLHVHAYVCMYICVCVWGCNSNFQAISLINGFHGSAGCVNELQLFGLDNWKIRESNSSTQCLRQSTNGLNVHLWVIFIKVSIRAKVNNRNKWLRISQGIRCDSCRSNFSLPPYCTSPLKCVECKYVVVREMFIIQYKSPMSFSIASSIHW